MRPYVLLAALLLGCSASANDATTGDDPNVTAAAVVPDCTQFDLRAVIAKTHQGAPSYQCRVSPGVSRSSQPDEKWIRSLVDPTVRNPPFRAVVNLRGEARSNGEAPIVQQVGMTPLNINLIDMTAPTRAQIVQFLDFASRPKHQPLLVHCHAGQGRTGRFVPAYRVAVQGWKPEDALREARAFNVNDPQIAFLTDFSKTLDSPTSPASGTRPAPLRCRGSSR